MKVKTNSSLMKQQEANQRISQFWDNTSTAWQEIWGKHFHHGYFESNDSIATAQEKLLVQIAKLLNLSPDLKILDVGCGLGSSSIWLAQQFQAKVTGITISQKQIEIANQQAQTQNIKNVDFQLQDAHSLAQFADNSFDIVWALESCEQFYNKNLFIKQAQRVLKPNGQLMIATWCADREAFTGKLAQQYVKICRAFDTPYMPTLEHYQKILLKNHFTPTNILDWSSHVKDSWKIGVLQLKKVSFLKLLKYVSLHEINFLLKLKLMRNFFQEGYLRYGVFIARK